MSQDIARIQPRVPRQDRKADRRSGVLPERRNTDAPDLQLNADVRSARRGDGGASELRRVLGIVEDGLEGLSGYAALRDNERKKASAAEGALDANTGDIDQEMYNKDVVYRKTIKMSQTQQGFLKDLETLQDKIDEAVNTLEDPEPSVRQAAIDDVIEQHFRGFALDQDGKPKDFGSPEATRWLGQTMLETRAKVRSDAFAKIEEQMNGESIATAAEARRSSHRLGVSIPFEDSYNGLLPTVDRKAAQAAFITVDQDVAEELLAEAESLWKTNPEMATAKVAQARDIYDRLLGSTVPGSAIKQVEVTVSAVTKEPTTTFAAPFAGFASATPSDTIGSPRAGGKRTHNGEDFPLAVGTAITAPMGGTVSYKYNEEGGHQAFLTMDNGDTFGIAHLNERPKVGRVEAGEAFAASGNSGKSTGPHAHMTVTVKGKKVLPSKYFAGAVSEASGVSQGPAADPSVISPVSVSERLATVPTGPGIQGPREAYSLNPEMRYKIAAARRSLLARADAAEKEARTERQAETSNELFLRLHGIGNYPTPSEIQQAAREGKISAPQMGQLLSVIEQDQNELEADARAAAADRNQADGEAKEATMDRVLVSLQYKLSTGQVTITQAYGELQKEALTIADPVLRAQVVNAAQATIGDTATLRTKGPVYQRAGRTITSWRDKYARDLRGKKLSGKNLERALQEVDAQLGAYGAELAKGELTDEQVDKYMDRAKKNLNEFVIGLVDTKRTYSPSKSK